jgi:hypothetical protein
VVCTRSPEVSLSIIEMSPGVISIFSSTSSRVSTSTRVGSSSMRCPVRVELTTISSSSSAASSSVTATVVSARSRRVSVVAAKPSFVTVIVRSPVRRPMVAVPAASVRALAASARTVAPATGSSSARTVTVTRALSCAARGQAANSRSAAARRPARIDLRMVVISRERAGSAGALTMTTSG